jgi:2-polyprenyl-3-methyl-5-hydroxy-6-metoxy-1,4-benzoquinol methylase
MLGQPPGFVDDELERLPACDVCGAPQAKSRPLFKKQGLSVNRCQNCGLIYVNPRLREDILWQRYSQDYFQNEYLPVYGEYDEERNYAVYKGHLLELERYVTRGRLFEFGAATGFFLAAARRGGWEVAGNELSTFAANYAQERLQIPVVAGRAEDVQAMPASYDAVVLWETIEHVQSPRRVLSKAAELLRPGGVLALSTPNIDSLSFRLLRQRWWVVAPREHIFYFSPKTLGRLFNEAGLKVQLMFTAGIDLRGLFSTLSGRKALPAHIRSKEVSGEGPVAEPGLGARTWSRFEPRVMPAVHQRLHDARLEDQLVVYALKQG